jgi:anti-sigma factor RsiW
MKCRQIYPLMQAYLDGEVTPEEERQVEAHIRACQVCRHRLVDLARTANRISDDQRIDPSEDFTRRLLAQLHESKPTTKQPR